MYVLQATPEEIARTITSYSLIVRKNEQSLQAASLGYLLIVVVIFGWWFWRIGVRMSESGKRDAVRSTAVASGDFGVYPDGIERTMTPVLGIAEIASTQFYSTLEAGYTPTPTITATSYPATATATATALYSVEVVFRYSYYNPKLGGVNCFDWDPSVGDCRSMMADGTDWRTEYGKAVACPPDIALGTVVKVHFPDSLKGIWVCRDRGQAIVGDLIDFLDIRQRAQWLSSVSATLYPPATPVEQIGKGTH